jgi:Protein of unknown function (DUF2924)
MAKTDATLIVEIAALRRLTVDQLRARYLDVFGEETNGRNKDWLFKRIAYRLQERKYGGLTEVAQVRAKELAKDAPVRRRMQRGVTLEDAVATITRDPRLPPVGTVLRRSHGGVEHEVIILEEGFEYQGKRYGNLSTIARAITNTKWNGFGFFGLVRKEAA